MEMREAKEKKRRGGYIGAVVGGGGEGEKKRRGKEAAGGTAIGDSGRLIETGNGVGEMVLDDSWTPSSWLLVLWDFFAVSLCYERASEHQCISVEPAKESGNS